jgi:hypothetical protein
MSDSLKGTLPALVIIIRHAEKPGETKTDVISDEALTDPNLAPAGYFRAGAYAAYFDPTRNGGLFPAIDHIFATKATQHSNRPVLTVTPLAETLRKKIHDEFDNKPDGIAALGKELLGGSYAGQTVLVCWHHGTMPAVAAALGYPSAPHIPPMSFDVVWRLAYTKGSPAPTFTSAWQTLMYGDGDVANLPLQSRGLVIPDYSAALAGDPCVEDDYHLQVGLAGDPVTNDDNTTNYNTERK